MICLFIAPLNSFAYDEAQIAQKRKDKLDSCERSVIDNAYRDCACLANALAAFLTANPDKHEGHASRKIQNSCMDFDGINAYEKTACEQKIRTNSRTNQDVEKKMCACKADFIVQGLKSAESVDYKSINGLKQSAYTPCSCAVKKDERFCKIAVKQKLSIPNGYE